MSLDHGFYKLLLVGDSNVGKTCIQQRYLDDLFLETANPTIGMYMYVSVLYVTRFGPFRHNKLNVFSCSMS